MTLVSIIAALSTLWGGPTETAPRAASATSATAAAPHTSRSYDSAISDNLMQVALKIKPDIINDILSSKESRNQFATILTTAYTLYNKPGDTGEETAAEMDKRTAEIQEAILHPIAKIIIESLISRKMTAPDRRPDEKRLGELVSNCFSFAMLYAIHLKQFSKIPEEWLTLEGREATAIITALLTKAHKMVLDAAK